METSLQTQALSRRRFLRLFYGGVALASVCGFLARRKVLEVIERLAPDPAFAAPPPLVPHDPAVERTKVALSRGATPGDNVEDVLRKLGGIERYVGKDDVVLIKISAQWWNQGMTNAAAVKRVVELILGRQGFCGEVLIVENTHFRMEDGSGLSRAFVAKSERNLDVPGFVNLGDLGRHFAKDPVSLIGLRDAGTSDLAKDPWHDPQHLYGTYGGSGRGPLYPDEVADGYLWDLSEPFRVRRSVVSDSKTPLSWPRFVSPKSGLCIDLRRGALRKDGARLVPSGRRVVLISMPTCNEHGATGLTACCKSAMGLVDMSAGRLGTDPRVRDFRSVHYFGMPQASWRMAGPLADFARRVRRPDLYLVTAEWVGITPPGGLQDGQDLRLCQEAAQRVGAIVGGGDPVAVDATCARHLLLPLSGGRKDLYDPDNPDSLLCRFLRYYRQVAGSGTLDPQLVDLV